MASMRSNAQTQSYLCLPSKCYDNSGRRVRTGNLWLTDNRHNFRYITERFGQPARTWRLYLGPHSVLNYMWCAICCERTALPIRHTRQFKVIRPEQCVTQQMAWESPGSAAAGPVGRRWLLSLPVYWSLSVRAMLVEQIMDEQAQTIALYEIKCTRRPYE